MPLPSNQALDTARDAGALCMVVRDRHWRPETLADIRVGVLHHLQAEAEDITRTTNADLITYLPAYAREKSSSWVHFDSVWAQSYVDPSLKRIRGTFTLPKGHTFVVVPRDTILLSSAGAHDGKSSTNDISASKSILKAVASIVQIVSAFVTLLSHRSDLIDRWGYASYHLTVMPYLFMTLVNLIGNLCIADYPCMYMVRSDTMDEAAKSGGRFEGEVAQTIPLRAMGDDLVEDLAYCGVTNEGIIDFATFFTPSMALFCQLSAPLYLLAIPFYIHEKAKPRLSKFARIDLHISGNPKNLQFEQIPTVSDVTPIVPDAQRSISSEGDLISSDPGEAERGVEMQVVEEGALEFQPEEIHFVEAVSSSRHYRVRICSSPQVSPVYGIHNMLRFAMDDRAKRSRWSALCASQSISVTLRRVFSLWTQVYRTPHQILNILRKHDPSTPQGSETANMTTFYHPSCSRFRRVSSPDHHTTSTEENAELSSEPQTEHPRGHSKSHTRWGVFLEMTIGLLLVSLFFGFIAALTHFRPRQSSTTERGIMMAWLASGLYGFCLPFMSTPELLRVLFLLPLVSIIGPGLSLWDQRALLRQSMTKDRFMKLSRWYLRNTAYQPLVIEAILSFLPLAIFIPPIWGFVLVGRMLVGWGNCTRLY